MSLPKATELGKGRAQSSIQECGSRGDPFNPSTLCFPGMEALGHEFKPHCPRTAQLGGFCKLFPL